jgi:hypothetical protein
MHQVINSKLYDTEKATLVTSDHYWDGNNWERNGRNTFLYKTQKGNYFLYHTTRWQREIDHLEPISLEDAKVQYEKLPEYIMEFKEVFGEEPAEA